MTPKPPRTSPCTPPADPGSAAVVAHASESSSGACSPSGLPIHEYIAWLFDELAQLEKDMTCPDLVADSAFAISLQIRFSEVNCALRVYGRFFASRRS